MLDSIWSSATPCFSSSVLVARRLTRRHDAHRFGSVGRVDQAPQHVVRQPIHRASARRRDPCACARSTAMQTDVATSEWEVGNRSLECHEKGSTKTVSHGARRLELDAWFGSADPRASGRSGDGRAGGALPAGRRRGHTAQRREAFDEVVASQQVALTEAEKATAVAEQALTMERDRAEHERRHAEENHRLRVEQAVRDAKAELQAQWQTLHADHAALQRAHEQP